MTRFGSRSSSWGLALIVLVVAASSSSAQGVNLSEWFQPQSASQVPFSRYSEKDFGQLSSLGVRYVRLPINLLAFAGKAPEYRLDSRLWTFLDKAVAWSVTQDFTLLVDNHSDPTDPRIVADLERFLTKVWQQLSEHLHDQPANVLYELQNEPHDIETGRWARIQSAVVAALRVREPHRILVVTGADWGGIDGMLKLPQLPDPNLVYSFHFYDPMEFTHQGASWAGLAGKTGVKFATKFEAAMMGALDRVAEFSRTRQVKVFCGEFGVYGAFSEDSERARWYGFVHRLLVERAIPWTMWDYRGSFGLFRPGSAEIFDSDVNPAVAKALGFEWSAKSTSRAAVPWVNGYLYRDSWEEGTVETGWNPGGMVDYADPEVPHGGTFSLRLSGLSRYDSVGWEFRPRADMSALVATGEVILWVRASAPFSLDLRFVMPDGPPQRLPWRIATTVDQKLVQPDGQWHRVAIKLKDFRDAGAWNGSWHEPQPGVFDWNQVARFEIVAESRDLPGVNLGLDDLEIR